MRTRLGLPLLLLWAVHLAHGAEPAADQLEAERFFESRVRPILAQRCYQCHSAKAGKEKGELALDSAKRIRAGGTSGPIIAAGQPDESLIVLAVRYASDDLQMPPSGKLPEAEIETLAAWVRMGAVIPNDIAPQSNDNPREFWSFQRPVEHALPAVTRRDWPRQRIDWFILEQLEREQLAPSEEAQRRTLIRRAKFDLLGLPPTMTEVAAFVADESPDAYERLIDRYLAAPQYGERWGRHWLDLARYTDVTPTWLKSADNAWLYRDWVVRALNEDLPFDEFAQKQLAADLLPNSTPADLAALGFLGLSPTYWKELKLAPEVIQVVVADEWEERIDAVSRTFLGLSVACAKCHDHKFDPITMQDYYALAGVFASAQLADRPLLPADEAAAVKAARQKIEKLEAEIAAVTTDPFKAGELRQEMEELRRATPHYDKPWAHVVEEASVYVLPDGPDATRVETRAGQVRDLPVFLRGNPSTPGEIVPRRFLSILSSGESQPFRHGSGRMELAAALFHEGLPLTSRVMVNRVWRHHFGRGLVATPSDFGQQGERPSHPELLDDLTARFIARGWSLKWLHREIMLSAAYRQKADSERPAAAGDPLTSSADSSTDFSSPLSSDPDNRWLWRMNRARLEIEPWRDAMLAASGELDSRIGGPPLPFTAASHHRRTLYSKCDRDDMDVTLRIYDFPENTSHSPARTTTTTPLQQLFVLNGEFVAQRARTIAAGLPMTDVESGVRTCYELLFQREPTADELALAKDFLSGGNVEQWREYVQVLLGSSEFMFVD